MEDSAKNDIRQEISKGYTNLVEEKNSIYKKILTFKESIIEHSNVIDILKPIKNEERECYRSIKLFLVKRSVKEVLQSVEENFNKLNELLTTYEKKLFDKEKEILKYTNEHNIKIDPKFF